MTWLTVFMVVWGIAYMAMALTAGFNALYEVASFVFVAMVTWLTLTLRSLAIKAEDRDDAK